MFYIVIFGYFPGFSGRGNFVFSEGNLDPKTRGLQTEGRLAPEEMLLIPELQTSFVEGPQHQHAGTVLEDYIWYLLAMFVANPFPPPTHFANP